MTRWQEIGFWIAWAIIGAYLLVAAGLFLFVPFVALVLLFNLTSRSDRTGSQARPLHLV